VIFLVPDSIDYAEQAEQNKKNGAPEKGVLYLCATPIGNLGDITLRALQCLREAELIAVESVRRSRKLLHYYGIRAPLISYREANRERKGREILDRVKQGARVALITDAGMPAISDPGSHLVRMLLAEKVPFTVLPGPSAALTALVLSGYSIERFVFWGFLSRKKKERSRELGELAAEQKTVVLYEAPHRLLKTLREMAALLGKREIAVCRELTKKFEDVRRGCAGELFTYFSRKPPRGEITIVISPQSSGDEGQAGDGRENKTIGGELSAQRRAECREMLWKALQEGDSPTVAVKKVAQSLGLRRKEVYSLLVELKHRGGPAGSGHPKA
jgi:16S rRNA (cytidine1402-2'-O)-methyltransferase